MFLLLRGLVAVWLAATVKAIPFNQDGTGDSLLFEPFDLGQITKDTGGDWSD